MINGIFLLMGGNLNDPARTFVQAEEKLRKDKIEIITTSSSYATKAWGIENQPDFLNIVFQIKTYFKPHKLLSIILNIEKQLGRQRIEKWGPRVIDIDILYFNQKIIDDPTLQVPHPEIQNRRFALTPMVEIAPNFQHPIYKKSQQDLLAQCEDNLEVKKVD